MNNNAKEPLSERPGFGVRATLLICVLLVLCAVVILAVIYNTEPTVMRESAVRETRMPVDTVVLTRDEYRPEILTTGSVIPSREVVLRPRISGEVTGLSDAFAPGGFVRKDETLLNIDGADYRIALSQRESELQKAIAELEIEHGRQDIALRDYRELGKELRPENRSLVLREPQLRSAQASVRAAEAAVEQARLDLQRTTVVAPFDAQVLTRDANLGSQVSVGDGLARLVGMDVYWVETTVPLDRLRWLVLPREGNEAGSAVQIRHRTAWLEGQVRWGQVYRLIGELEGNTRMARVLVAVEDPLSLRSENVGAPQLIIGSFVQCTILGEPLDDVVRIDRKHLRKNNTVWLSVDGALSIRSVNVVLMDAEYAYVDDGLVNGDRLITTSLATVKDGILLSERETDSTRSAGSDSSP